MTPSTILSNPSPLLLLSLSPTQISISIRTMKASIKFREGDKPLLRAKVPIGVLGLPFLSGFSAGGGGDAKDLRFDLTTAFSAGPAVRVSYRPNDSTLSFSLSIKTGLGPLGSPTDAPFSIAAEFSLLGPADNGKTNGANTNPGSIPAFSLLFKPKFGDFCLKNCVKSTSAAVPTVAKLGDSNGEEMEVIGLHPFENGAKGQKTFPPLPSPNGLGMNVPAPVQRTGIGGLLSGVQLTANSMLPLLGRAAMRFQWGLRVPPELQTAFKEDYGAPRRPGLSISKLPLLVMSKITIEQLVGDKKDNKKSGVTAGDAGGGEGKEGLSLMKRQIDALNAESGLLKRAVEDLQAEVGTRKVETFGGSDVVGRNDVSKRGAASSGVVFSGKGDRRGNGKDVMENGAKVATDEVGEELKKALDARRGK